MKACVGYLHPDYISCIEYEGRNGWEQDIEIMWIHGIYIGKVSYE